MGVAGHIVGEMDSAAERIGDRAERRLERDYAPAIEHLVTNVECTATCRDALRSGEIGSAAIDLQRTARGPLEAVFERREMFVEHRERVRCEPRVLFQVDEETIAARIAEKTPDPRQHAWQRTWPDQQRRILAAEHAKGLAQHTRLVPRAGLARMQHAAIREAGLEPGARTAFEHGNLGPVPTQEPRSREPEQSSPDDDDVHDAYPPGLQIPNLPRRG